MTNQDLQALYPLQKKVLEEMVYAILPMVEEDLELEVGCILENCFLLEEREVPLLLGDRSSDWLEEGCQKSWYLQRANAVVDWYIMVYSIEGHNQQLLSRSSVNGRLFSWNYIRPFLMGFVHECRHFWQFFMRDRYAATGEHNFIHDLCVGYHDNKRNTDEYIDAEIEKDAEDYCQDFVLRYKDRLSLAIFPIVEKMESLLNQPGFFREDLLQTIDRLAQPSEVVQNEV